MEHAFGLEIPFTLAEVCHPQRTVLTVYDMQVGIVSQIADGARVVACVASVLEAARKAGYRVFFTRHMSLPKEVAGVTQLRTAMEWQRVDNVEKVRPQFLREAPGFPITPEVAPLPTETVIDKITMSAFEGTYLDIALRDCGINSFVIVGIALEVGIEPTVRHAMDLGYIPVLVTDACGYGNWEAAQRSLAALKFAGGSLQTDSAAVIEIVGGTSSEQRLIKCMGLARIATFMIIATHVPQKPGSSRGHYSHHLARIPVLGPKHVCATVHPIWRLQPLSQADLRFAFGSNRAIQDDAVRFLRGVLRFSGGLGRTEAGVSQPWTCPLQGISSFNLPTFGRMINTCVRSVFWERRCSSVPTSCSIRARSVGLVNQPKTGKTTQQLLGSQTWRVDEEKSA